MRIEIIGAESLGVRGLCCFVEAGARKILIDPGIALGYVRNGFAPHPAQVAVGEAIREDIKKAWRLATDIVLSHYHGDHVPLVDANPYQLDVSEVADLNPGVRVWAKTAEYLSTKELNRSSALKASLDAKWQEGTLGRGSFIFSTPVPHGEKKEPGEKVMMTRIEDHTVFVHASDIQLLDDDTVDLVLEWKPDVLLAGGPPLYLQRLSSKQRNRAWENALRLANSVDRLILDHHLLRNREGLEWLRRLSMESGREVLCAADFMGKPRLLLEAERKALYDEMPVPPDWHQDYAEGKATTRGFHKFIPGHTVKNEKSGTSICK
ncbi:MAG: MBL fold metallo-hydrolase [Deltaproteobacteria bacterium]|nr:MBL fold metallo-hydrolase [Deltaproteobacteria bacterium]